MDIPPTKKIYYDFSFAKIMLFAAAFELLKYVLR